MANYSVNQNRQFYVAKNGYTLNGTAEGQVTKVAKTEIDFYFLFNGAAINGVQNKLKSDYIPLTGANIRVVDASKNITVMKKVEVTLDGNVNSGNPVQGQDYVLGINFRNFFSSGDGSQYYKDAVMHAVTAVASDLYKGLVKALNKSFAHEDGATATSNPYLKFEIKTAADPVEEGGAGWDAAVATGIIITEKAQEWELGTKKARRIMFDVQTSTIYLNAEDVEWSVITDATPAKATAFAGTNGVDYIGNGQGVADLEWFGLGERGDQYRNVGWPNVIPTKYLADETKVYDLIEIHCAYTGTGVSSYRSEKEITIAAPYDPIGGTAALKHAAINAIITAINAQTSYSIPLFF